MNDHPTILFHLDTRSDRPPFRQLVDQVAGAFERGQLQVGDQLPSVREVVRQITINPNTVHRAYRELEHQGIAEGRAGLGTFITSRSRAGSNATERASLDQSLQDWVADARRTGLDEETIRELIRSALHQDRKVRS